MAISARAAFRMVAKSERTGCFESSVEGPGAICTCGARGVGARGEALGARGEPERVGMYRLGIHTNASPLGRIATASHSRTRAKLFLPKMCGGAQAASRCSLALYMGIVEVV